MKKIVLLLIISFASYQGNAVNCECGTHKDGITAYNVDGKDCCTDVPGATAFEHTYIEQYPGVWVLDGSKQITGSTAQTNCCRPA